MTILEQNLPNSDSEKTVGTVSTWKRRIQNGNIQFITCFSSSFKPEISFFNTNSGPHRLEDSLLGPMAIVRWKQA